MARSVHFQNLLWVLSQLLQVSQTLTLLSDSPSQPKLYHTGPFSSTERVAWVASGLSPPRGKWRPCTEDICKAKKKCPHCQRSWVASGFLIPLLPDTQYCPRNLPSLHCISDCGQPCSLRGSRQGWEREAYRHCELGGLHQQAVTRASFINPQHAKPLQCPDFPPHNWPYGVQPLDEKSLENINAYCLNRSNFKKRKLLLICVNVARKDLSKYYS